jgi:ankyrin repeat protein
VALVEMDTALHDAVEDEDVEAVRQLVEEGADVEAQDADGDRPLHLAAQNGHLEVVRVLVDTGAHVEAQAPRGTRRALGGGADVGGGWCRLGG